MHQRNVRVGVGTYELKGISIGMFERSKKVNTKLMHCYGPLIKLQLAVFSLCVARAELWYCRNIECTYRLTIDQR